MKAGLFIATAALYAIACILYLFRLTRGSEKAPRLPGIAFVAALGAHLAFLLFETPSPGELPLADMAPSSLCCVCLISCVLPLATKA